MAAAQQVKVDFEKDQPGKPPQGFSCALTGQGSAPAWVIEEDPTAPAGGKVLAETSAQSKSSRFPLCVYDGLTARDLSVSVSFKPLAGAIDQAAGVAVRLADNDNYYVVRANALEDNVRLYKVQAGKRTQFAGLDDVKVPKDQWHTLELTLVGSHFQISMDGRKLFEADDKTFSAPGKIALWTKADSVTRFDNLLISSRDE
jgi:hypothetical protein